MLYEVITGASSDPRQPAWRAPERADPDRGADRVRRRAARAPRERLRDVRPALERIRDRAERGPPRVDRHRPARGGDARVDHRSDDRDRELGHAIPLDRHPPDVITSYSIHYTKLYDSSAGNRYGCGRLVKRKRGTLHDE